MKCELGTPLRLIGESESLCDVALLLQQERVKVADLLMYLSGQTKSSIMHEFYIEDHADPNPFALPQLLDQCVAVFAADLLLQAHMVESQSTRGRDVVSHLVVGIPLQRFMSSVILGEFVVSPVVANQYASDPTRLVYNQYYKENKESNWHISLGITQRLFRFHLVSYVARTWSHPKICINKQNQGLVDAARMLMVNTMKVMHLEFDPNKQIELVRGMLSSSMLPDAVTIFCHRHQLFVENSELLVSYVKSCGIPTQIER